MPSLLFDDPIQQAAHASWSAGFVFADLTQDPKDPGQISVWHPWTRERGKAFDQKLSALGAKLGRRKNDEWRLPASTTNLRALEHLAGDLFDPTERLEDWFFAEVERLNSLDNLASSSSDAVLSAHTVEEAPKIARMAHAYQRAGIVFGATTRRFGLFDQPGLGKASPVSEPILTPSGWVKMGDIRVGDRVVGADGCPTEVLGVFPQGKREVVEVTFSDGTVVRCDWDHLWQVRTKDHRRAGLPGWTRTARELKDMGLYVENGKRKRFDIPMVAPVQFDSEPYPLDAYTVGVLIGDGSTSQRHGVWITTDHEIIQGMSLPKPASLTRDEGIYGDYFLPGLSRILRDLGLSEKKAEQKSIPEPLLHGSVGDRIALLQGLLDTDGAPVSSRGGASTSIEYGTVSSRLSADVVELVQSLGGTASVQEKIPTFTHKGEKRVGQLYYRMCLHLPSGITPFRLQRKLDRWVPRSKYEPSRSIVSIEGTGEYEQAQCIRVAAADSLYVTTNYVVTHNTLQCFGAVVEAGITGDILVLAPTAAVAITWPDELAMWLPEDDVVVVNGDGKRRKQMLHAALDVEPTAKRRWFIVNLEMARSEWVKPGVEVRYPKTGPNKRNGTDPRKREFPVPGWWDYKYPELFGSFTIEEDGQEVVVEYDAWATIVVDESHRGLITKTSIPQDQTLIRAGMGMLPLEEGGLKIAMSGTPMRGKVENLWGTLNWLYPELYSSYWDWVERWFTFVELDDGKSVIDTLDESKSGEFYRDIQPYILRRTKKEVRAELPDKLYAGTPLPDEFGRVDETSPVGHWLEMHPKQAKAYAEIVAEAETRLESGILAANGRLAELVRMKQFASSYGDIETYLDSEGDEAVRFKPLLPSNKFDWIVEFLESLGITKNPTVEYDEDGNPEYRKVVIASQFTSLIDLYDRELTKKGIKCLKITGKVNTKTRVEAAKTWQNGEDGPRVFLLNTMAGGVALTLDSADDLILVDETFIPDEQEQVEDRIHRVSRMHQVTIHYLRSLGTVEETIAMTTSIREKMTKLLLDGERGVKFFKKLVTPIKRS